jgi:hypothetical protein
MARTTISDVKAILGTNYDTINTPTLTPYIRAANLLMDRVNQCATERGYILTTTELQEMERWMAAHFYTIYDPIYKSKQTANSSATYFDRSYMDAAKAMDPSGCLNAVMMSQRVNFDWLGKTPNEQIDVDQRY